MNFFCFENPSTVHNCGSTDPILVGFSTKCTSPNGHFNQIETENFTHSNFRLIPLDCIPLCPRCHSVLANNPERCPIPKKRAHILANTPKTGWKWMKLRYKCRLKNSWNQEISSNVASPINAKLILANSHLVDEQNLFVCLFVCLTGRPCGTRLGPGGPDSSKSSSQAKKPM